MIDRPDMLDKFEIIACLNLGGDYRKIILTCPDIPEFIPSGACAVINGRWLAVAGYGRNRLHFVVKLGSWIFREKITAIEVPVGKGFSTSQLELPYCVAAGTGIGALSLFLERQHSQVKSFVLHRGLDEHAVIKEFPVFQGSKFWNTTKYGRPEQKQILQYAKSVSDVFVAGPKSLVEAIRETSTELNFKLHTNF